MPQLGTLLGDCSAVVVSLPTELQPLESAPDRKGSTAIQVDGEQVIVECGEYNPLVKEFQRCLYDHGIVRDFDWPKWLPRAVRIFRNPSLLRKARMKTCLKLLTLHIRRDRFCDGHLGAMLASGHITAIIRRMDTFVQNSTPNLAIYSLAGPRICDRGHMIRRHNSHQSRGRLPSGF